MKRVEEHRLLARELSPVIAGKRTGIRFSEHSSGAAILIESTVVFGPSAPVFFDRLASAIRAHEATLMAHVLAEAKAAATAEAEEAREAACAALRILSAEQSDSQHRRRSNNVR